MPIQFRCQHCRQLLGISRSRAGSTVDCPACGRSLRVPLEDGSPATADSPSHSQVDQDLQNALLELSNFETAGISTSLSASNSATISSRKNSARTPPSETESERDSLRIVPLSAGEQKEEDEHRSLADRDPGEMTIPLIVPELIDLENSEDRFRDNVPGSSYSDKPSHPNSASRTLNTAPNNPGWALQELVEQASEDNVTATISSSALPTHRLSKAGWWIGGTFSALAAFAGGFFVGRMSDAKFKDETTLTGESASTGESTLPVEPHEALLAAASAPELTVSGRIMFVDGSGKEQPDSEAFLLLVPAENAAGLKLDATPLRSLEPSAAQEAVEAAIRILNGSVARAAQDGTFVMDRRESGPMKLVAISRHASRPESTPVESAAAETIAAWFDSPSQLTGRLQVQEIQIPSARQNEKRIVNVTFNRH